MKEFKGTLRISSVDATGCEPFVRFNLVDENSGLVVTQIDLDLESYGALLSSNRNVNCSFNLNVRGIKKVGKIREVKQEVVTFNPETNLEDKETVLSILKPYEKDGWQGSIKDLINHRRGCSDSCSVTFTRYITPSKKESLNEL